MAGLGLAIVDNIIFAFGKIAFSFSCFKSYDFLYKVAGLVLRV